MKRREKKFLTQQIETMLADIEEGLGFHGDKHETLRALKNKLTILKGSLDYNLNLGDYVKGEKKQ